MPGVSWGWEGGREKVPRVYPQREGLGEDEPHYEIAGERVETLERLNRGAAQVIVTTARATAERTLIPAALEAARLELAAGVSFRDAVARLERMGYGRVPEGLYFYGTSPRDARTGARSH